MNETLYKVKYAGAVNSEKIRLLFRQILMNPIMLEQSYTCFSSMYTVAPTKILLF